MNEGRFKYHLNYNVDITKDVSYSSKPISWKILMTIFYVDDEVIF